MSQVPNKTRVRSYTSLDTYQVGSTGATLASGTTYQAACDGMVIARGTGAAFSNVIVKIDNFSPPTTAVGADERENKGCVSALVRAGEYWQAHQGNDGIMWVPLI